ncbi:V-type proton ATPase 116 kDa subunit a 3 isoform X4 [Hoplias malabaricus]|uniref:V-type proton ATPase 116 kDa subunit a 3 isoform X4 n=1 Tax=Hoplias malabaricus TaxID=27720 RepID=UPI00346349D9
MGSLFRSEEVCLVQIFLQSGSAYNCVSELGELGLVEFRDLNSSVNAFQRKFVSEVRRCEEMEKTFTFLEQEIIRSLCPPLRGPLPLSSPLPSAPQPRELLAIEEESERLAKELKEVSRNRDSLRNQLTQLSQYKGVLVQAHLFTATQGPLLNLETTALLDNRQDIRLSFVAGVVHPWKVAAFERLLWRACRGYIIVDFWEMEEKLEVAETGEMVQWTVFLISFWGEQIGQKVKKICDCFRTHTFAYPESTEERDETLQGLQRRIFDITTVLSQTECYMQQLLSRCVCALPQWKVRVQKCKAVQMVLNLCSLSVTDKCLIAEAWCPVSKLLLLQSALIEGTRKSGSSVDSFYNHLPSPTSPPTLFNTNAFTAGFQSIVDAYGMASYREVNPAVYTIVTFPFLFAVMFGDVGHGVLMTLAALWMLLKERDSKMKNSSNEMWQMIFGGRYLILLMGLFSIYTGAVYNECFSKGLSPFPSGWHLKPMIQYYNWRHFGNMSSVFLVLIPELVFMLSLFGYLVFMVVFKWIAFGPQDSSHAPSLLIHFIDMFLFSQNPDNPPLYPGQMIVQRVLVVLAMSSVPVLLLGKPVYLYLKHRRTRPTEEQQPLVTDPNSINTQQGDLERGTSVNKEFEITEVFMHQAIHTIEYCLGCISNTASYLRLWALSLAHAQLSEVLWVMVIRISLSWQGYEGSVILAVIFSFFAMLTVSILLIMEGLSAFLHALRLHWVEFQNKFYSGTGYKLNPFSFSSNMHLL